MNYREEAWVPDPAESSGRDGPTLEGIPLIEILRALAVPGLGRAGARRILLRFGSVDAARGADEPALRALGLKEPAIRALRGGDQEFDPEAELAAAEKLDVRLVHFADPRYPPAMRRLDDPPLLLYVRGELLDRDAIAVTVVGTRRASIYGVTQTSRLAGGLARAGFTVISGMARGVDAAAHDAALRAGGRTLAVIGSGLGNIYPPDHEKLAERIAASGAVLSELPLATRPAAANFPPRNRLLAALALGVVVVEAPRQSGALITARLAAEMGKEVFAVPGDISRPQSRGVHALIREGAKLVTCVEDIIEEFGPLEEGIRVSEESPPVTRLQAMMLNERERAVYEALEASPSDIDEITGRTGLSPANVASVLTMLEMRRLARRLPGGRYVRRETLE